MKKAISLILVLVLCLSLCACGGSEKKSKYVGKYKNDSFLTASDSTKIETTTEMCLNKDGTGTIVMKSASDIDSFLYGKASVKTGDVLLSYELEWEESDGYLVITGSGMRHYDLSASLSVIAIDLEGNPVEISKSFELKGNKLFEVGKDYASYTKSN